MGGPRAWVRCESPYTTEETVNGSQSLIRSLLAAGVDICPMNPGTSEMHFVSALDDVPEMRGVVGLFEGGATSAPMATANRRRTGCGARPPSGEHSRRSGRRTAPRLPRARPAPHRGDDRPDSGEPAVGAGQSRPTGWLSSGQVPARR